MLSLWSVQKPLLAKGECLGVQTSQNQQLVMACGAARRSVLTTVPPCLQGPEEKPVLCNACGAHYLVKKSLSGYMPGQRASSVPASSIGSPAHSPRKSQQQPASSSQQHDGASPPHKQKQQRSHKRHAKRHALLQDSDTDTGTPTDLAMQEEDHSAGVVCSSMSPGATSSIQEQQDCLEYEHPAVVASSRKKSRLVACSVYEVRS